MRTSRVHLPEEAATAVAFFASGLALIGGKRQALVDAAKRLGMPEDHKLMRRADALLTDSGLAACATGEQFKEILARAGQLSYFKALQRPAQPYHWGRR